MHLVRPAASISGLRPSIPPRNFLHTFLRRTLATHVASDSLQITLPPLSASFPYLWLRDACQCPRCVHPSTKQKLHRLSDVRSDVRPALDGLKLRDDGVHITWTDGHQSFHSLTLLERYSDTSKLSSFHRDAHPESWDASTITQSSNLFVPYSHLSKPSRLLDAITQLSRYGLLFVTGIPTQETDNATCETRKLASLFGELRLTFYGELWDVKNVTNSRNIAYTDLDIGLHGDLLYFEHPPRYQILHCLKNRVTGGMSIFADGFHTAYTLRKVYPDDFETLSTTPVPFHYINDGHHLHYEHPTIELESFAVSSSSPERAVKYINYSPPFQAPFVPSPTLPIFQTSLKRFATLIDDPANRIEYTLREGDATIFDNRRVLHARTAFTDAGQVATGEPNRWLKGCYVEADTVLDRGRVLREKLEEARTGSKVVDSA
ncbi:hypothetical protein ID866_5682 [Astraeus odoratus]|nr:hypothetical protein ID866_5682 [Astraeus odoratus]